MTEAWLNTNEIPLLEDPPDVELLQWLARGSLKQNLKRAIRLWVWLHSLYGDEEDRLYLAEPFTYWQWRDTFFSATHSKGELSPTLHDPNCACAKTTEDWLFTPKTGLVKSDWLQVMQQHSGINLDTLNNLLHQRLFAVTRRSLASDLEILVELGWLRFVNGVYFRTQQLPRRPISLSMRLEPLEIYDLGFLNPYLEAIAQNLSQPIAEVQRFFLEADYIIALKQKQVEPLLEGLKAIWNSPTGSPVQLTYRSVKYGVVSCIVYPVCIYYVQRAIYLSGFGDTPLHQGEWYNYRLDKIQQMVQLDWHDPAVPKLLRRRRNTLPPPSYIRDRMCEAWGFDFYLPIEKMLLRFQRNFHDRYIQGTFRHSTFKRVTYQQAISSIRNTTPVERQSLLPVIQSRSPEDAYYVVLYRHLDTNVGLRLRSWRQNVEVLLPWKLRQEVSQELQAELQFYQDRANS